MTKRKTTAQFVQDARKIHGKKYDYSMVEYVNAHIKVKIICPVHGLFVQVPNSHLSGNGCPYCGGIIRKTTTQFIDDARKIHGDKYDYSMVDYENHEEYIKIICPTHGLWNQRPGNHLKGYGCADCAYMESTIKRTKTTTQFIQDARKIHGDKYDYSMVEYTKDYEKVKIICHEHGLFEQRAGNHLQGQGCAKCIGRHKTTTQFIQDARKVHGDKYDYSMVEYSKEYEKVKIICHEHGLFEQQAGSHLQGRGCAKCFGKDKTTSQFIQDVQKVHGDKYDYSMVEYANSKNKVKIICPEHGVFEQNAGSHLRGTGCQSCSQTGFNKDKEGILYFLKFQKNFATFWKIGITNLTVEKRFGGDALFVTDRQEWRFEKGLYAYQIEQTILKEFAKFRYEMPLFSLLRLGGNTECFSPSLPHKKVIATVERLIERIKAN